MGHHLTEDGQFKSDKYPDLRPGKIILSFKDRRAQLGLWTTALDYQADDPELCADMMTALDRLGFAPPRAAAEDAWAWAITRRCAIDPRKTARVFARVNPEHRSDDERMGVLSEIHIVSTDAETITTIRSAVLTGRLHIIEHLLVPQTAATEPSAETSPDFAGFLNALRAPHRESVAIHEEDCRALAEHVERVGRKLGLLP